MWERSSGSSLQRTQSSLSYMEGAISTHLMPDASQRGVKRTTKAVLSSVGTAFQVSKALCA
eukprot:1183550-Amphidinium_carterae.1